MNQKHQELRDKAIKAEALLKEASALLHQIDDSLPSTKLSYGGAKHAAWVAVHAGMARKLTTLAYDSALTLSCGLQEDGT